MRAWTAIVGLLGLAVGCGAGSAYGAFVEHKDAALSAMAVDAADRVNQDFPTGRAATMAVVIEERDAFGVGLENGLRQAGHSVRAAPGPGATTVRYVVDPLKGTPLLRVTLYVADRMLSRAYEERSDGVHAVGPWTTTSRPGGTDGR